MSQLSTLVYIHIQVKQDKKQKTRERSAEGGKKNRKEIKSGETKGVENRGNDKTGKEKTS